MLFVVQFEDRPEKLAVRAKYLFEHIKYLERVTDQVLVAGSLSDEVNDKPMGGLWIVEANDEEAVRKLFDEDPFHIHGLRASHRIYRWSKAFPDRRVPI